MLAAAGPSLLLLLLLARPFLAGALLARTVLAGALLARPVVLIGALLVAARRGLPRCRRRCLLLPLRPLLLLLPLLAQLPGAAVPAAQQVEPIGAVGCMCVCVCGGGGGEGVLV